MAQKQAQTTYTTALNLRNALQAKGLYPQLQPDMAVYDGAQNDQHLLHGQFDDGSFRTINIQQNSIGFDFIVPTDSAIVRIWVERELQVLIGSLPGVGGSSGVFANNSWTWTIKFNSQNIAGSDSNKPDAIAKALINVLALI